MISVETLAASKKFTSESLLGGGAVVGKNVTVSSITPIDGGNRVTFSYTLDDGTVKTSTLDVMNGVDGKGVKGDPGQNGQDGIGISKIEKTKTEGLIDTYVITFSNDSTFEYTVTNGKDGKNGSGSSTGEENVIESIKVNGVAQTIAEDKSVDITVPTVDVDKHYVDTELAKKANTSDIPSLDGYVTDEELNTKGYLTSHQDISSKVDKVKGKSLIADTEIERLKSVKNYDDTDIKTELAKKANSADVTKEISDKIAEVVSDAPEDYDTLKEISDWISGHENDASAMNSAIKDNKSAITTLQTDKASKTEIPTELPANGGNADTVNGHTVKSDVPENAIFTDTVYDDTEVQKRISDTGYSNVAGGKNLLNPSLCKFENVTYSDGVYTQVKADTNQNIIAKIRPFSGNKPLSTLLWETLTSPYIAEVEFTKNSTFDSLMIGFNGSILDTVVNYDCSHLTNGKKYKCIVNFNNIQQGTLSFIPMITEDLSLDYTDYEPYFPSNKMITEENTQQSTEMMDIKMLGWSVPRECPIQNEVSGNQFVQKVGRVDLGSLEWLENNVSGHERLKSAAGTTNYMKAAKSNDATGNIFSSIYTNISANDNYNHVTDKSIAVDVNSTLWIYDSTYTDASAFKSAMQGQYLYYELATPITTTIDGNEIGETVGDVRKETTVNLLNPTLQTTTVNGVTCTNNGNGTFTINGTSSDKIASRFRLQTNIIENLHGLLPLKLVGNVPNSNVILQYSNFSNESFYDKGNGVIITKDFDSATFTNACIDIEVKSGDTANNVVIKPMLTTNLNATYDDFVPYTGDTGKLNGDVADLIGEIETKAAINDTSTISTIETWSAKKINEKTAKNFDNRIILSVGRGTSGEYTDTANLNNADGAYLYWSSTAGQEKYSVGVILYVNNGWIIIPIKETDGGTDITFSINKSILTMTKSSSTFPSAGGVIALGTSI